MHLEISVNEHGCKDFAIAKIQASETPPAPAWHSNEILMKALAKVSGGDASAQISAYIAAFSEAINRFEKGLKQDENPAAVAELVNWLLSNDKGACSVAVDPEAVRIIARKRDILERI